MQHPWSEEALSNFRKDNEWRSHNLLPKSYELIISAIDSIVQRHSGDKARSDALKVALSDLKAEDRQQDLQPTTESQSTKMRTALP